ncbi:5-formyltetrahydrofolate cyclo-ligase, mitochondrial-like isoform X3 [Musa acuminata AAA Group]|uniref:5-formyltetrahydrofolate cyclo-ligase, mitochondrial-like isoform X3 n=1 Tax=Musa acuminata AAA Group TaxID=214697 RepID=UPI0031DC88AE
MSGHRGGVLCKAAYFLMTHCHHHHPTHRAFLPSIAVPVRCAAGSATPPSAVVMSDTAALQQKRALRSRIRKALKEFSPAQRALEDVEIQNFVLNSSWFKSCKGLCAYISCKSLREVDTSRIIADVLKNSGVMKKLYVPRVEDKNSHMRMLRISTIEDLVANSMNILEPSPVDSDQSEREDVLLASQPVDLLLLPGLAFDRHGRRLGRGGGYYDVFLRKYEELANQQNWKQPLRVALAYTVQIVEDELIPMTETDVPVDALVSSNGVFPISPAALERM